MSGARGGRVSLHWFKVRALLVGAALCLTVPLGVATGGAALAAPPSGAITSPRPGALLDASTVAVDVEVTASSGEMVTLVVLNLDGVEVARESVSTAGGTVTLQLDPAGHFGLHQLTAVITQGNGEATTTAPVSVTIGGSYTPLTPARILDTRSGIGTENQPIPGGGFREFAATSVGRVPAASGVASVVLNVTVTNTASTGYLTVYPADVTRPLASNLNFRAGETRPNLVVVPVAANGKVRVFNGSGGDVDVVADVQGWVSAGTTGTGRHALLTGVAPSRVLDTRSGTGAPAGPVDPSSSVTVQLTGRGGVPVTGVSAVVLNVTVTGPTSSGYLTAYAGGGSPPTASNLNFVRGQTVPNLVIVPVGAGGQVSLYNGSAGSTHVVADVFGYYSNGDDFDSRSGGATLALPPSRILDTRSGVGAPAAAVRPGATVVLQVAGVGGVPTTGVGSAILNVTVTGPTGSGYLTVYPGPARPLASNLNFTPGLTVPNLVVTPVNGAGQVLIYNGSAGYVHVVADVTGWVTAG